MSTALQAELAEALAAQRHREGEYFDLLGELRALRSAMSSAASSRSATRQGMEHEGLHGSEQGAVAGQRHEDPMQQAAAAAMAGQHTWQQAGTQPGQLMVPPPDEEHEQTRRGLPAAWEQPRQMPEMLQHLRARDVLQKPFARDAVQ